MALNQLETRQARQSECGAGGSLCFPMTIRAPPGPLDKEATSCLWCRVRIFIMDFIPGQDERGKARRGNGTGHLHAGESRRDTFVSFPAVLYSHTHRQSECIRPARWQIGNQFTWIPSRSLLMHQKLSASMFRNTSSCKLETLKFSTSSSAKSQKTKENKKETEKKNESERQRGRKMEDDTVKETRV